MSAGYLAGSVTITPTIGRRIPRRTAIMPGWSNVPRQEAFPRRRGHTSSKTPRGACCTSARPRACAAAVELLREPGAAGAAHRADGHHRGDRRVDRGAQRARSARCSSTASSSSTGRASTSAWSTTSRYPFLAVTLNEELAPRHGHARARRRRASDTSDPTATPTPSVRRWTCCCARFPSAPAASTSTRHHARLGTPVPAVPHREVCRAVRRRDRSPGLRRCWSKSCWRSSTATPTRWSSGSSSRCSRRRSAWSSSSRRGCATV